MIAPWFNRERLVRRADGLAIAVAVSLPLSTTATSILIVIWLVALLPTIGVADLRRALTVPAGALPVILWALASLGMLWSNASWYDRLDTLGSFHKLLFIPLLLIQFSRVDRGSFALIGFAVSCVVLLCLSWLFWFWPMEFRAGVPAFIPVKDYGTQSGEFLLCAYALAHLAIDLWRQQRRSLALALTGLMLAFLANLTFVVSARAMLLAAAVLVVAVGLQRFGWKGAFAILIGACIFTAISWAFSPYLRGRAAAIMHEYSLYREGSVQTSTGYRLEFWTKSVGFVASAPVIGHGTGSIEPLFRAAAQSSGSENLDVTDNPHDLTLQIAIQLGLLGVAVLYAMWAFQLMLFRGSGMAAWIGTALVVWCIVGGLFVSHLLDFTTGWIYVFGVGITGGMVLAGQQHNPTSAWIGQRRVGKPTVSRL
jgi:O-antigen ligase